jgi:F-type H+-transporting ATPase subunit b
MANPSTAGDAQIAEDLAHPLSATNMVERPIRGADAAEGHVGAPGGEHHVAEATAFGFDTTGWVALAAVVVLVLMLWKKVPALIGGMLDARIATIRAQLDEANRLRAEAEALRAEYQAKAQSAHRDAETIRAHAHQEAHAIVVKAKTDAEALMERRARMAEDRIAAAERGAMAEVRARAAEAASRAAGLLIAEHHDAAADRRMIDGAIAGLGRPN